MKGYMGLGSRIKNQRKEAEFIIEQYRSCANGVLKEDLMRPWKESHANEKGREYWMETLKLR
jgi:hypothetical protein